MTADRIAAGFKGTPRNRRRRGRLAAATLLLLAPLSAAAQTPRHVDVLLVLAADVSRSVDAGRFELQRQGYAAAIKDPRVLQAIAANPDKTVAVAFVEWSGAGSQALVVDWTPIANAGDADAFSARLAAAPRSFADRTAIGTAIDYAVALLDRAPFAASRRIIDLSGDGVSNSGRDPKEAREAALGHGVTALNGLVILAPDNGPAYLVAHTHPPGGLANYYKQNVTGGVASFVVQVTGYEQFERALIAKIVEEIS